MNKPNPTEELRIAALQKTISFLCRQLISSYKIIVRLRSQNVRLLSYINRSKSNRKKFA